MLKAVAASPHRRALWEIMLRLWRRTCPTVLLMRFLWLYTMLGRRGTADDLQGPNRRQALTILHTSICNKAGHCDFTGRMLTSPVRPGPETSRPGPARPDGFPKL